MKEIAIEDVSSLSRLHCESFSDGWSASEFTKMLSAGSYFGFICGEGFIIGRKIFEECEIFAIAVSPKFRSQGIGASLLKKFHEKAKSIGAKKIFLEVRSDNIIAQNLYLSNGYKTISRRQNYYGKQDAIIMQFTLT